jgi:sulfate/thiosulfate transport system permease protein
LAAKRHVLPGLGLGLGITLIYLTLLILVPLATIPLKTATMGWDRFVDVVTSPRAVAAYKLSFGAAFAAAALNAVFGLLVAWVLERYRFPGRRLLDGLVDLPFALPTAVAGIALTTLYSGNGWIGRFLEPSGLQVAYSRLGVIVALTFVGLPFVVRSVQPVLASLAGDLESAAASLGASRWTIFRRVLLPRLVPAILAGCTLAFARGLGEYGSVIFIAGNLPLKTEIVPLLIVIRLEEFDYPAATAIALVFLLMSFAALLAINLVSWRRSRAIGRA